MLVDLCIPVHFCTGGSADILLLVLVSVFADVHCWNPAFDVTPAELITGGIITEFGVFAPHELKLKVTQALNSTYQST